jgi:hypothetical protein
MFVTSSTVPANGGIAQMHMACASFAGAAGLPNSANFKALISTSVTNAKDILPDAGAFALVGSKAIVANDKSDLLDGTIAVPISKNQNGSTQTATYVWSGSQVNGTYSSPNACADWTTISNLVSGVTGASGNSDYLWINGSAQGCNLPANLYCFGP